MSEPEKTVEELYGEGFDELRGIEKKALLLVAEKSPDNLEKAVELIKAREKKRGLGKFRAILDPDEDLMPAPEVDDAGEDLEEEADDAGEVSPVDEDLEDARGSEDMA